MRCGINGYGITFIQKICLLFSVAKISLFHEREKGLEAHSVGNTNAIGLIFHLLCYFYILILRYEQIF